jgi:hypothetical protein
MDIGVARLFQQRPHNLRSFHGSATTARLAKIHDVAQVALVSEPQIGMALVQAPRRIAGTGTSPDPAPLVSKVVQEVRFGCHGA